MLTNPTIGGGVHGWLIAAIEFALFAVLAWTTPSVVYCLAMLAAGAKQSRQFALAASSSSEPAPCTKFHILIPAHDESLVIASTVAHLAQIDYPRDSVRITVIADNCSDNTADLVRAADGIEVLERSDPNARGKGYALNWALALILERRESDAIVIMDADTLIDRNFLTAMDRAYQRCAKADQDCFVGQGLYKVQNSDDNWRTALMAGALSLVHYVRPMARERWRTSVGLKGNGMCFAASVLDRRKWPCTITEDLDYGLDLIECDSVRVRFVPDAIVEAQMPTDSRAAAQQRRRWEGGRRDTVRRRLWPLFIGGIARGDVIRVDAALDLMCPPLAQQSAGIFVSAVLIGVGVAVHAPALTIWCALLAFNLIALLVYVFGGFRLAGAPKAAYAALWMAIAYIPWKIAAVITDKKNSGWKRTERMAMEPKAATDLDAAKEAP